MSGSDNIYLHFADDWDAEVWDMREITFKPFLFNYIYRIVRGCVKAIFCKQKYRFVYSASDFWMDCIPAAIMKLKGNKWIAGFYLFAPQGNWIYRLTQKLSYHLVMKYADHVFITSEPDRDRFPGKQCSVVRGGIDYPDTLPAKMNRLYDALFIGRLHPQKGVFELLEIWKRITQFDDMAQLAIVGDGPLYNSICREIKRLDLKPNITLLGYLDGKDLEETILQSHICVHPAIYDSGGMAICQAMAYGLPAIGFNLPAYETYYPYGMIKVPAGNIYEFALQCILLIKDELKYKKYSEDARAWAKENAWPRMLNRINKEIANI
jgi:glycosyltransferase involved in cell wall biosynthesis